MALVMQYLFNDNCNDETGNYNGTGSRVLFGNPPPGYSFGLKQASFDGWNNSTRTSISFPSYNWNSTWTVETWYKRYHAGNMDHFLHAGTSYGTRQLLHLGINNGNRLMIGFYGDDLQAPETYRDSNWHHLVFTYNSSTRDRQIFCDGVRVANDTASGALNATSTWYLGWYQENRNFCGSLGNLRVYNEVISADTVLQHYNAEKADIPQYNYNHTGNIQTFTAPVTGYYRLEAWGGAGGGSGSQDGGTGGFSTGVVFCRKNQTLYIGVGGEGGSVTGTNQTVSGAWNGGGSGYTNSASDSMSGGGGGATHIATATGTVADLSSDQTKILMVAGGGAGGHYSNSTLYGAGGQGGGYIGGSSRNVGSGNSSAGRQANGGTQTAGGVDTAGMRAGSFGAGFSGGGSTYCGGGGGGWYGGSGASMCSGGGGSGYIANSNLLSYGGVTKHMFGYEVATSSDDDTRTETASRARYIPGYNAAMKTSGFVSIELLEQVDTFKRAADLLMMM